MSTETNKTALTPIQALEAIKARIEGVWDNEQLKKIGVLTIDPIDDINYILEKFDLPI